MMNASTAAFSQEMVAIPNDMVVFTFPTPHLELTTSAAQLRRGAGDSPSRRDGGVLPASHNNTSNNGIDSATSCLPPQHPFHTHLLQPTAPPPPITSPAAADFDDENAPPTIIASSFRHQRQQNTTKTAARIPNTGTARKPLSSMMGSGNAVATDEQGLPPPPRRSGIRKASGGGPTTAPRSRSTTPPPPPTTFATTSQQQRLSSTALCTNVANVSSDIRQRNGEPPRELLTQTQRPSSFAGDSQLILPRKQPSTLSSASSSTAHHQKTQLFAPPPFRTGGGRFNTATPVVGNMNNNGVLAASTVGRSSRVAATTFGNSSSAQVVVGKRCRSGAMTAAQSEDEDVQNATAMSPTPNALLLSYPDGTEAVGGGETKSGKDAKMACLIHTLQTCLPPQCLTSTATADDAHMFSNASRSGGGGRVLLSIVFDARCNRLEEHILKEMRRCVFGSVMDFVRRRDYTLWLSLHVISCNTLLQQFPLTELTAAREHDAYGGTDHQRLHGDGGLAVVWAELQRQLEGGGGSVNSNPKNHHAKSKSEGDGDGHFYSVLQADTDPSKLHAMAMEHLSTVAFTAAAAVAATTSTPTTRATAAVNDNKHRDNEQNAACDVQRHDILIFSCCGKQCGVPSPLLQQKATALLMQQQKRSQAHRVKRLSGENGAVVGGGGEGRNTFIAHQQQHERYGQRQQQSLIVPFTQIYCYTPQQQQHHRFHQQVFEKRQEPSSLYPSVTVSPFVTIHRRPASIIGGTTTLALSGRGGKSGRQQQHLLYSLFSDLSSPYPYYEHNKILKGGNHRIHGAPYSMQANIKAIFDHLHWDAVGEVLFPIVFRMADDEDEEGEGDADNDGDQETTISTKRRRIQRNNAFNGENEGDHEVAGLLQLAGAGEEATASGPSSLSAALSRQPCSDEDRTRWPNVIVGCSAYPFASIPSSPLLSSAPLMIPITIVGTALCCTIDEERLFGAPWSVHLPTVITAEVASGDEASSSSSSSSSFPVGNRNARLRDREREAFAWLDDEGDTMMAAAATVGGAAASQFALLCTSSHPSIVSHCFPASEGLSANARLATMVAFLSADKTRLIFRGFYSSSSSSSLSNPAEFCPLVKNARASAVRNASDPFALLASEESLRSFLFAVSSRMGATLSNTDTVMRKRFI